MSDMQEKAAVVLLLLLCFTAVIRVSAVRYNTTSKRDPNKLNIHLVPHTHDDSGWLKTFEQYYWGTRQDIQVAAVQHVLSTVMQALKENPDRKFSYGEMSFFSKWWQLQPAAIQDQVRQLVANGQLDFINGGFVQHDEATAHYCAMIDQTTRGHRFLNATFGVTPRIAWQIDPFGHSATQATLMSAAAGYEALFFGRADYQDMALRSSQRQLELLWRPSLSWGEAGQVFTHNYPSGNYGPPMGFNFDWGQLDTPIVDDPSSPEFNVPARVNWFVVQANLWASLVRGNDVLMMMGSDFQYANAHANFINLDRLIHHVNADGRVNVFYSTAADYVAAKAAYPDVAWPVKTDDFFPYADCAHCYWTGFFTSRPTSKGYIRQATAYLAAARQLQALTPPQTSHSSMSEARRSPVMGSSSGSSSSGAMGRSGLKERPVVSTKAASSTSTTSSSGGNSSSNSSSSSSSAAVPSLDGLEFAVSISQHHDAVTGTEKQAVADDYARYLYLGMQEAAEVVNDALLKLMTGGTPTPSSTTTTTALDSAAAAAGRDAHGHAASAAAGASHMAGRLQLSGFKLLLQNLGQGLYAACKQACALLGVPASWKQAKQQAPGSRLASAAAGDASHAAGAAGFGAKRSGFAGQLQLSQCALLNVSICLPSVTATATPAPTAVPGSSSNGDGSSRSSDGLHVSVAAANSTSAAGGLLVVVYNSLGWPRQEFVRVPVAAPAGQMTYAVQDADGEPIPGQLVPISVSTLQLQQALLLADLAGDAAGAATHELVFKAEVPPVGYATFAVQQAGSNSISSSDNSDSVAKPNSGMAAAAAAAGTSQPALPAALSAEQSLAAAPAASAGLHHSHQLSNGVLNLTLDPLSGRFASVGAADGSWSLAFSQDIMWYKSCTGDEDNEGTDTAEGPAGCISSGGGGGGGAAAASIGCSSRDGKVNAAGQSSGAYIFRPAGDAPVALPLVPSEQPLQVTIVRGPLLTEVRQTWSSWASLTTRLWAGATVLEQDWTVGPIPVTDGIGKEIIIRTNTDLKTTGTLFTDSNGREMLKRQLNHRPTWPLQVNEPVAGNYYPITAAAAITDGCMAAGLATDRAQGAASLEDGQLEVMVHRVTTVDDARGVGEPLNETLCGVTAATGGTCIAGGLSARGRHTFVLGLGPGAARLLRQAQQALNDPLLMAFAKLPGRAPAATNPAVAADSSSRSSSSKSGGITAALGLRGRWSGVAAEQPAAEAPTAVGLPANVHLLTLMRADEADPHRLIVRLAHGYQVGEDAELSLPAKVDLSKLLPNTPISSITELSLTAAKYKADMAPPRSWKADPMPLGPHMRAAAASEVVSSAADTGAVDGIDAAQAGAGADTESSSAGVGVLQGWGDAHMHGSSLADEFRNRCQQPRVVSGGFGVHRGRIEQQHRKLQQQRSDSGAEQPTYNIWDHSDGDALPIVELYAMEIRTWELTLVRD